MLSLLLDLLSSLARGAWDVLGFLVHSALDIISAIASLVTWPVRTMVSTLGNWWGWAPAYLLLCGVLLLLLLGLTLWAAANNRRKKFHR